MCTSIVEIVGADGAGKGDNGEWFKLTHSVVSYDHPHHALLEEAITIDFVNSALGPSARVAVELTLEAAKELSGALTRAIAAAEVEESERSHRISAAGLFWQRPADLLLAARDRLKAPRRWRLQPARLFSLSIRSR